MLAPFMSQQKSKAETAYERLRVLAEAPNVIPKSFSASPVHRTPEEAQKRGQRFCAKEKDGRPALCGVRHTLGLAVAIDGIRLVAIPTEYEGKAITVGRGGEIIPEDFPDWRSIIPKGEGNRPSFIDGKKFMQVLRCVGALRKQGETAKGRGVRLPVLRLVAEGSFLFCEFRPNPQFEENFPPIRVQIGIAPPEDWASAARPCFLKDMCPTKGTVKLVTHRPNFNGLEFDLENGEMHIIMPITV